MMNDNVADRKECDRYAVSGVWKNRLEGFEAVSWNMGYRRLPAGTVVRMSARMDCNKAALECGINFIDTAPAYNAGKAECYVGETLSKLKKRREVVISTKCGNKFVDGKYLRCGSKESILKQCDESLKNLKTDYIDIYLVHWPDPDVELEETIDAVSNS